MFFSERRLFAQRVLAENPKFRKTHASVPQMLDFVLFFARSGLLRLTVSRRRTRPCPMRTPAANG